MTFLDLPWPSISFQDLPWTSMTFHELLWPSMTFYDLLWLLNVYYKPWTNVSPAQINSPSNPMLDPIDSKSSFHLFSIFSMDFYGLNCERKWHQWKITTFALKWKISMSSERQYWSSWLLLSVRSVVFSNLIVTSLQPAGSLDFCRLKTIHILLYK